MTNKINWDDQMTVESAMNSISVSLKTWHYQMAPKYSFDYFVKRCQALGSNKFVCVKFDLFRPI